MADISFKHPWTGKRLDHTPDRTRPLALRTYSEFESESSGFESEATGNHARGRSAQFAAGSMRVGLRRARCDKLELQKHHRQGQRQDLEDILATTEEKPNATGRGSFEEEHMGSASDLLTPPSTPEQQGRVDEGRAEDRQRPETIGYDFSSIDYELDRARCIGKGLWSSVYLAQPVVNSPRRLESTLVTPPSTPERRTYTIPCSLFAVKMPARPDAKQIFAHEARMLSKLQRDPSAQRHIVPFHGLDPRDSSLVFSAVIGGSLENLTSRLKVMTEVSRHLELRSLFPNLADDLVSGLHFVHASGVVHADIKPANILLDISEDPTQSQAVIRARYIDFSASFTPATNDPIPNAGGTWDFMAPEQLRIPSSYNNYAPNTPSFTSDVWSLGITLLSVIAGGSPYAAACGDNHFMLREAIKAGDPLGFARMEPVVQKRMAACQDFVDLVRLALQKDPSRRVSAEAWRVRVEGDLLGL